jgi:ABC-type nitrate/sulfonate/bicarbonate transport system substrate-binding protein
MARATARTPAASVQGGAPPSGSVAVPVSDTSVPVTARVTGVLSVRRAGVFLGISRGYFAEDGLDVDLVPVDAWGQALPVLATTRSTRRRPG